MKRSLRSWLWRVPVEQEVDEEIAFHLEMRTRELIEGGMDPEAARQAALDRLGDVASLKRTCVDLGRRRDTAMHATRILAELADDVKIAVRQMRRAPGFMAVAVLTLALGIGANSAIFALVDATLLRPLPLPAPERLVTIWERSDASPRSLASPLNLLDWSERNQTFERMSGFVPGVGGMVMAGRDGSSETVTRQWVLAGFFDVLGVHPIVGRTFSDTDNRNRANVVVLSDSFWRTRFGADPSIVGRDIRLDGEPFTVVGVVPDHAQILTRTSIWALRVVVPRPAWRGLYAVQAIGRLKPGVSLEAAAADMSSIASGLAQEFPRTNEGRGVVLHPMHDALIGSELRLTSLLFLGVVGFVLLICCANVANLLLARATVRARELAVRSALGAGRPRVIRQLVTESLVLAAIGGAIGLAFGAAILRVAPSILPEGLLPGALTPAFDWRVAVFCAAAALLVGLLFGIAPAWQATAFSSTHVIGAGSRGTTGRGGRVRALLVVAEVATATVLLFGGGLLLRTLMAVESVDRGYRANDVLTMMVDPLASQYPTDALLLQFYDDVEREVAAVPGVRSVSWASTLPLGPSSVGESFVEIPGAPPVDESRLPTADYQLVGPAYFATLDLPIVSGRAFDASDNRGSAPVCIVNEALVRRHFQGRDPVGQRIALRPVSAPEAPAVVRQIVGVARQVKGRPDEAEDLLQVYVPMAQDLTDDMFLVVRPASEGLQGLASSVRAAIARVDRRQLVSVGAVMTLDDVAYEATARHRFRAVLVATFAGLALVLAMVGVFGILAYTVQQRVRDIGVRRALGATSGNVLGLVAADAVRTIGAGVAIGFGLSAVLSQLLASVLFGVRPLDPATFGGVAVVLTATAVLAIAGPAWRATRIDPVTALRVE